MLMFCGEIGMRVDFGKFLRIVGIRMHFLTMSLKLKIEINILLLFDRRD